MTIVAVKQVFVEEDAKRRQMQHELNLLHAFSTPRALVVTKEEHCNKNEDDEDMVDDEDKGADAAGAKAGASGGITASGAGAGCTTAPSKGKNYRNRNRKGQMSGITNIVHMYDAYTVPEDRCMCLVLEFMSWGSLDDMFVRRHQRLTEPQLAHIAHSCLLGLSELRRRRLIHRDIKPSNVLMDHHGRVKLSDFGVMREFGDVSSTKQIESNCFIMTTSSLNDLPPLFWLINAHRSPYFDHGIVTSRQCSRLTLLSALGNC